MLVAGGLPVVLVFPDPNLEFLAWFALVPGMIMIVAAATLREALVRTWWFGCGYLIAALYWMAPEIGPGVLLLGAVFGGLWVPFGVAAWKLLRPPVTWRRAVLGLVVVPSCWLICELVRSWQALGGPWNVYGASQWQHPAILALASVGGIWLVSFALVAANVAISLLLLSARADLLSVKTYVFAAVFAAIVCSGPLAFALTSPFPAARQVTIAMVQPGVINDPNLRTHASETLTADLSQGGTLGGARPDLIVWGESSIAFDLFHDQALLGQIEALSAKDGAEILVNQDVEAPGEGHEKWGVLVSPSGIKGTYIKSRLVPFGEYIPFRQQLGWLTKISKAASSNMAPGPGAHLMQAVDRAGRPLPIGVLTCFESAFPDMSRVDTDKGAQLIVYQSETVTFQGTWGPDQHGSLAAVRAAETGRPVVQATLTGDTVAFDARGRQLAWMGQSSHGVLTVRLDLPSGSMQTIYDQWGDYVLWTSLAVGVLSALVMLAFSRGLFSGRAGNGDGHAAQYASGQSVPR
jgi:apolipoprotein N-acyltransferase